MGCYGNEQVMTPNFDAFSERAVRFENCISNSPLCVPSRGTLLTGLLPMKHGAIANDFPINSDVTSVAHQLGEAGYRTGYIGKWHLAGVPRDQYIPEGPGRLGFEEWKACNCNHSYMKASYHDEDNNLHLIDGYEPIRQTDLAVDFIHRHQDRKWALYLSWGPPHDPYMEVPQHYLDLYRHETIALRDNVPPLIRASTEHTLTREQIVEFHKGYYAHITALDEQFGRLWEALEATGQADNTIVVYTSDHGDMLGSQGLTHKQLPYEESIKVPLMVYWKGNTFAGSSDEMIGLADLPTSLLGFAGVDLPKHADGQDLHRLFIDPDAKGLSECYCSSLIPCHQAADRGDDAWRAIRTERYTFAYGMADDDQWLFDNKKDPLQNDNLAHRPDCAVIKNRLLEILNRYVDKHDGQLPWEQLVRVNGFKDEWNKSQAYFKRPLLD